MFECPLWQYRGTLPQYAAANELDRIDRATPVETGDL
jgi:hypothetical protein